MKSEEIVFLFMVIFALLAILLTINARVDYNHRRICHLQLSHAVTSADSTVIYDGPGSWYLRTCKRDTG